MVKMRTGETVIVCGASADRAQFEPFEWPEHALVWVGVGCGFLDWVGPVPEDASEDVRDEIARAYVRLVCDAPMDLERAARGVSSWLRLIERAAKVPCAMVIACGGVRVSAVPFFKVTWNHRTVTVSGESFRVTTKRRACDEVGSTLLPRRILAKRGISVDDETHTVVSRCKRSVYLRPRDRCALCDAPIWSRFSTFVRADERGQAGRECSWMRISVCAVCPVRSFRIWRTEFTVANEVSEHKATLFDEGAHESAWQAGGRVVVTLALALTSNAVPNAGTFAAALAPALRDMKLLRVVAERFVLPVAPVGPPVGPPRALGILVERYTDLDELSPFE
jgi:hypothetical protein